MSLSGAITMVVDFLSGPAEYTYQAAENSLKNSAYSFRTVMNPANEFPAFARKRLPPWLTNFPTVQQAMNLFGKKLAQEAGCDCVRVWKFVIPQFGLPTTAVGLIARVASLGGLKKGMERLANDRDKALDLMKTGRVADCDFDTALRWANNMLILSIGNCPDERCPAPPITKELKERLKPLAAGFLQIPARVGNILFFGQRCLAVEGKGVIPSGDVAAGDVTVIWRTYFCFYKHPFPADPASPGDPGAPRGPTTPNDDAPPPPPPVPGPTTPAPRTTRDTGLVVGVHAEYNPFGIRHDTREFDDFAKRTAADEEFWNDRAADAS